MADQISQNTINITPTPTTSNTIAPATEFLKGTETSEKDALYSDLFQKNNSTTGLNGTKVERSKLELATTVLGYIVPVIVILAILGGLHAFIKSQSSSTFAENYQFLCGYLNSGIDAKEDKGCKTAVVLENEYKDKTKQLQSSIVNQLATYIPIKISANAAASSPENKFITASYADKVNTNTILTDFEAIRSSSQSPQNSNIECKSLNITAGNVLTVQCSVYGGNIGDTDENGNLWSSRIEATRFIERIANTPESHFVLQTPPTSLSVEDTSTMKEVPPVYKTRTMITLSLKYSPFTSKL